MVRQLRYIAPHQQVGIASLQCQLAMPLYVYQHPHRRPINEHKQPSLPRTTYNTHHNPLPLPPPPPILPPLRTIRLSQRLPLQHLRMLMHTRHQAHTNRPANRLGHLALVHVPQARLPRVFDPPHLRAELLDHREILPNTTIKVSITITIPFLFRPSLSLP